MDQYQKDILHMSQQDLNRLHVIRKVLEGTLPQLEAASILNLSDRQVRRIQSRILTQGDEGIAHKARGRLSNQSTKPKVKARALLICKKFYPDFGPTLASEKLFEGHGIKLSDETLRTWFREEGIIYKRRKDRPHRNWRERKASYGEMIQMDGSHHAWLEDRGPKLVLMAYKDDATGEVFARFYDHEGTIPALDSFRRYILKYGIPQSVYFDKHASYKTSSKPTIQEELKGQEEPLTQFGRVLEELGVTRIYAHSPQAKGRIERLFRTFQDRLVKELRLKGAKTQGEANQVLGEYLPVHNKRFRRLAANEADLHRPLKKPLNLRSIFSIKVQRTMRNDFTIVHEGQLYQILDSTNARELLVEKDLSGRTRITHAGRTLRFKPIPQRPAKDPQIQEPGKLKLVTVPLKSHPWRKDYRNMTTAPARLYNSIKQTYQPQPLNRTF